MQFSTVIFTNFSKLLYSAMLSILKRIFPIVLTAIFFFVLKVNAQNLDVNILKAINPRYPTSDIWSGISGSGYWLTAAVPAGTFAYGLIEKDKQAQHDAIETAISIGISSIISEALKRTINATRPADKYPNEIFVTAPDHGRAFPSGHTTLAFATATSLTLEYKKWYIAVPAYAWASAVGYSRMYKGYHLPSQVLSGAAIGVASAYASHWIMQKLWKPKVAHRAYR
ncbi:phosphatase PAP2 family protein [Ilyomonas limi]|uniref:Phosphatase PAP2 family protein n=1 Tax=Ilyomonas limi TaxID=2575867 RepID=A0A4U3L671_9BACT|nr:phosphatase PAP2 family protein [Ilyomonas limi]TKK70741.1 phosphatase PAP2 family protein [Ilyomonas limi]